MEDKTLYKEKIQEALKENHISRTYDIEHLRTMFDSIVENIKATRKQNDNLREQIAEWNKDAEIQKWKERAKEAIQLRWKASFTLTEGQIADADAWEKEHWETIHPPIDNDITSNRGITLCKVTQYTNGYPDIVYKFSHTAIGTIATIECETCKARLLKENNVYRGIDLHKLKLSDKYSKYLGEV